MDPSLMWHPSSKTWSPPQRNQKLEHAFTTPKVEPRSGSHSLNWATHSLRRLYERITPPHSALMSFIWEDRRYTVINMSLLKLWFIRNPVLVSYSICMRQGSSDLSGSQSALACLCVCARAQLGLWECNTPSQNI
jgi:hypothetical protein